MHARVYAEAALGRGPEHYDYGAYEIFYGDIDNYKIEEYVGKGKYSQVFKGVTQQDTPCIIKVLKPIREKKVNREAKILKSLVNYPNIVQLMDIVRDADSNTRSFVFYYQKHEETRGLFRKFTVEDIRYYGRKILSALDAIHGMGIMHRDIKPHNIIIDHERRELRIIDWGLAEYYLPGTAYTVGVASMHFKAPELLVNYRYYNYSIDLWAFGCVMCEMVLRKMPMFDGANNEDQLIKIVKTLGSKEFFSYIKKYGISPTASINYMKNISEKGIWISISEEILSRTNIFRNLKEKEEIFEVLEGVLQYDHQSRLTARECLNLPFFKET
ncbi:casein kinase II subunit alpha [Nematocida sp. LUAm2]|nr:casein kinase II subunit alpha [Nematocida sp. LUAm2]